MYFNPLSLYRERRIYAVNGVKDNKFQSTLPIQGETTGYYEMPKLKEHFNPLSLYRERQ